MIAEQAGFDFEVPPPSQKAPAYARATDPATSHVAAQAVEPRCAALEEAVLNALKATGGRGCTIDELVAVLRMDKVTLSPRLRPLCKKGFVEETLERRPGVSGRSQIVWKAK